MVVIQPQVIKGEAEGFDAPPLEVVENGLDDCQHVQSLIFFLALTILIPLVEVCTLNTVVLGLIARFALLRTIFLANVILLEDVLHAVRGFGTNSGLKNMASNAGCAVVGD